MKKPVLFRVTNNLKVGGVQKRLRALLPLLTEHYEVHVVTYKERGVFFDELAALGVRTHFLPRRGHWDPVAIWKLAQLFRQYQADIVHTHSFGGNIFGILAAALARVPVRIGQVHSGGMHWYGSTALRRKKQMLEEMVVHRFFSHKVLFVSRESRDHFQKCTGLPESMLLVLHNGLDLPKPEVPSAPRTELGLPETGRLFGFVGRITHGKGLDDFLEIARTTARLCPDRYHFVVIGNGDALALKREWVIQSGLANDVTFLGEQRDIHRCYRALDALIFCSPPGMEGMPGVVLEACAHGLPILARETSPLREISEYYPRITLINDNHPLDAQLQNVLNLPVADQDRFREEFSIGAMKTRTLELYAELSSKAQT